ncbi:MAG: NapC/NirT family cytochrome c [Gammaproteobacteria bacterium]|nr:NapC/NirT family cytochrome c [Gammaproteobacteria bacterium]
MSNEPPVTQSRPGKGRFGAALAGALVMLLLVVAVVGGEAALSTTGFCTSCHSMSYPAEELRESSHYGALGADPGCKDCHIPQGMENLHRAVWAHLADGSRDLLAELTRDYAGIEAFDERRLEMAHRVRMQMKAQDSLTCRRCHSNPRPPGRSAKAAHARMQSEGLTCIDCHQNLVHDEVEETDLTASLARGSMVIRDSED